MYHEINTRYNIYYNAEMAYEDALENKNKSYQDNLSQMIYVYPYYPTDEQQKISGFDNTIDKCVKAIKLHSVQTKPERNPSKRGDMAYQQWLQQKEFNPFLKRVWLLMAKAEYQSLDYVRAISTFSYITRLFKYDQEVVTEANLWIAKAYTQMGWFYEAEHIFHQIELDGGVPKSLQEEFSEIYADYLIRNKKYEEAIPYLQQAIRYEGGTQNIRLRYLLAQLYAELGNEEAAYDAFGKVQGLRTPYLYTINSQLQQAKYIDPYNNQQKQKTLSSLGKMTKSSKNEEYLDQIYYGMGNIYLMDGDSAKTIENYKLGIEKSIRNGFDKAMVLIGLGDIYFRQREYVKAQPLYPEALGILGKKYERYKELTLRSEVLDELVVYVEAIHLQDSLQTLAKMPEEERLQAIYKLIEEIKRQDREEEKRQAQAEWAEQNVEERPNMVGNFPIGGPNASSFYFYNNQVVAQGKTTFRQRWGNRRLEDNWRRRDKASTAFDDFFDQEDADPEIADSLATERPEVMQDGEIDKYSPEYYLKQLPLTEEAMKESNDIIEDGYYQMGLIYRNKLGDLSLAIEAFDMVLRRFPQTINLEEIYYQLFLIYSQLGDKNMAEIYRSKLLNEFPQGDYAITLSDPDYEWNLLNLPRLENELYENTYNAYLVSNIDKVRQNYATVKDTYPLSGLMPKFMFLNALTYAQTNDSPAFRDNLKELIEKYPQSDVIPLASEMLTGLLSGKPLGSGGPMRGMIWNIQFSGGEMGDIDTTLTFIDKKDTDYRVLLIFDPGSIDRNDLIYNVADYNFSTFMVQTFDLTFSEIGIYETLQIQGLQSFRNTQEYINKLFDEDSLIEKLDSSIVIVPVSGENYSMLTRGKSLAEYMEFFIANYSKEMPELVAYWKGQMGEEEEIDTQEDIREAEVISEGEIPEPVSAEEISDNFDEEEIKLELKPKTGITETIEREAELSETEETDTIGQEKDWDSVETDEIIKAVDTVKGLGDAINAIGNNPVDGIKGLIEKNKNKPKLTKEEKETLKEEERLRKEQEKIRKASEKAVNDSIQSIEKAQQDSIKTAEKALKDSIRLSEKEKIEMEKAAKKAKEDARKNAQKEKEDARKERQKELKEKEKERKERQKQKEKERKERQKEKERERKERQKQREQERKERQRQRSRN